MAFVKFNTRTLDQATRVIYEPSNEFVEVSETFARRIKELMQDPRHKDSFEFKKIDIKIDKHKKKDD